MDHRSFICWSGASHPSLILRGVAQLPFSKAALSMYLGSACGSQPNFCLCLTMHPLDHACRTQQSWPPGTIAPGTAAERHVCNKLIEENHIITLL